MKAFLAAAAFYVVPLILAGIGYDLLAVPAKDAFSTDSARVEHAAPPDGRLGWAIARDGT